MRAFVFVGLGLLLAANRASAWEEQVYLDKGVAIQFPDKPPQVTASTYDSVYGRALPATVYSAEDDHVIYRLTVVDLPARRADASANFVNELVYSRMREGEVLFTDINRVYGGEQSVFGITLAVDRTDGNRVRTSVYGNKGRLYLTDAIVTPARGDKDLTTPSRFDQTIRFPPDGRFD